MAEYDTKEGGEIQKFNASKEIAQQRDVKLIIAHVNAMKQARTGETPVKSLYEMSNNERTLNKVRGLTLTIHAQKELILISRALVRAKSLNSWNKENKTEEEKIKNAFEEEKNDYNKLIWIQEKLDACEKDILEAERSKTLKDDFMITKNTQEGDIYELTENYREMLHELEDSYEEIELIMYRNGVISAGIEIDEEKTNRELEEEMIKRIVEA